MQGPTQTAEWGAAERWRSRPIVSRVVRALIFLMPILISFGLSWWASKTYPPSRVGLNTWVWWIVVAILSFAVMVVTDRFARRFLPLAALLRLSLVFPDEAPSRFRNALRKGTTNQLDREIKHIIEHGEVSDDTTHAEYLIWLMRSLADHDRMTRGHSERVRAYTDLIAEEMGLPQADREKLHWAALLHDVGKLDVPYDILNKDGRPDAEEWEVLKEHPAASMTYLAPLLPWLGEWAHAADEHHLRWDGHGYPTSTAGTDISLAGRIVAVADAYDVMTSTRSYKKSMPHEDARAEIARCAGGQFDPAVTRAFLNIGLGKVRVTAGPLSWLGHTLGLESVPIGTLAAPAASAATTATRTMLGVAAVTSGAAVATPVPASDPAPVVVAFEDPSEEGGEAVVVTTLPNRALPTTTAPGSQIESAAALAASSSSTSSTTTSTTTSTSTTSTTEPVLVRIVPTTTVAPTLPPRVVVTTPPETTTTTTPVAPTIIPTTTVPPTTVPPTTTASTTAPSTTSPTTTTTPTTTAAPTTTTGPTTTIPATTAAPTTTSTTTTTTTTVPVNTKPGMKPIPDQTAYTNVPVNIQPVGWDDDGDTLTWSATGLPSGLTIDPVTGLISGTIAADAADQLFPIKVKVSDGDLKRTRRFDLTTLQFALSPHHGEVFISEVHFFQIGGGPEHEFVEVVNTGSSTMAGFKLLDFNPLSSSGPDTSIFFLPGSDSLAGGERMTVWFDAAVRDPEDAPDVEIELGLDDAVLDNFGDDLYLFDADWNLVDYVAYGGLEGNALDVLPTTDVPVWDGTGMLDVFLGGTFYNSLSLASHDPAERDRAECWEYTASDAQGFETAVDRGCANANATVDSDDVVVRGILFQLTGIESPRVTNVGRAEW